MMRVKADSVDRLPPRDRICADDRMYGFEVVADVVWGAAGFSVEFDAVVFGSFFIPEIWSFGLVASGRPSGKPIPPGLVASVT